MARAAVLACRRPARPARRDLRARQRQQGARRGPGELAALFATCAADAGPSGARAAAAFALMFGAGLRRAEAAAVRIEDYDVGPGAIRVVGKGNKERIVYVTNGGQAAIDAWIAVRGTGPGPLLNPVSQRGVIRSGASITA